MPQRKAMEVNEKSYALSLWERYNNCGWYETGYYK